MMITNIMVLGSLYRVPRIDFTNCIDYHFGPNTLDPKFIEPFRPQTREQAPKIEGLTSHTRAYPKMVGPHFESPKTSMLTTYNGDPPARAPPENVDMSPPFRGILKIPEGHNLQFEGTKVCLGDSG